VAIGAAAATQIHADRLAAALAAFFLAVGVGAHSLDELNGRPLRTQLSDRTLEVLAAAGLGGALAIGVVGVFVVSVSLVPFVLAGAFLAVAYSLELFDGRFHTDFWFAAAWGGFPALTGWWANSLAVHDLGQALAGAGATLGCFWISIAQRRLSTPVRELRRRTVAVSGEQRLVGGRSRELTMSGLAAPLDGALRALSVAMPLLAAGLVALRI
jgi:hypothetical protein